MTTATAAAVLTAAREAPVTPYDGCGNCWVGVRRLSRTTDKTSSPERQAEQILKAAADNGGHVIDWADDWEVSGATDPLTRPGLGPWLLGKMGPYDGVVAPTVDRIGRDVRDCLNTQVLLTSQGRAIVTHDHVGVWDFTDPNQENEWLIKALGSQLELRAIQKRNRDDAVRARGKGEPHNRPGYGYRYERANPASKIERKVIDEEAAAVLREVKDRILAAYNGELDIAVTPATEAARLTRAGVPTPNDHLRQMYGRPALGKPWHHSAIRKMLRSEAALGYLMHGGRPVIGPDGRPVQVAPPLWDRATHEALIEATEPRWQPTRAPTSAYLLSGIAFCGQCGTKLRPGNTGGRPERQRSWYCTGRLRGLPAAQDCKPAPSVNIAVLDAEVARRFLAEYGWEKVVERVWDPGTGHAAEIKELEAARERLRADRQAGLYDSPSDTAWFQEQYRRMTAELDELAAVPPREPGFRAVPTGEIVADKWNAADVTSRREMLMERGIRVEIRALGHGERITVTGPDGPLTAEA